MPLHDSTFEYLKPTDEQIAQMAEVRTAARGERIGHKITDVRISRDGLGVWIKTGGQFK